MTRNPERIDPMIELLREEWHDHPDQRLGQLVSNLAAEHDAFGVEDTVLARRLAEAQSKNDPFEEIAYFAGEDPWDDPLAGTSEK